MSKKFLKLLLLPFLGVLLVVWFWRGTSSHPRETSSPVAAPMAVETLVSIAARAPHVLTLYGETMPSDTVTLLASTAAYVDKINTPEGQVVSAGTLLVTLTAEDKDAMFASAEATLAKARKKYTNSQLFFKKNIISASALQDVKEALRQAESQWERARIAVGRRYLRAPSDGLVSRYDVRHGSYVDPASGGGGQVGTFVRLNPLMVRAHVSQFDYKNLQVGQKVDVLLANGEKVGGTLTYVGKYAEAGTRTFQIDVKVPNKGHMIPAGLSAQVLILRDEIEVHQLPVDVLSLTDEGTLGVKAVNDQNRVVFYPVTLLSSNSEGASVSGLPSTLTIIARGQDFVREGDKVTPHPQQKG